MKPFRSTLLLVAALVALLASGSVLASAIFIDVEHDTLIVPTGEFVQTVCLAIDDRYSVMWSADYHTQTTDCSPYHCEVTSGLCNTSCASNADCVQEPGIKCDTATGACVWVAASCRDSFTKVTANGIETSCAPYKCEGSKCNEYCATSSDCAAGYECRGQRCVPPPPPPSSCTSDSECNGANCVQGYCRAWCGTMHTTSATISYPPCPGGQSCVDNGCVPQ